MKKIFRSVKIQAGSLVGVGSVLVASSAMAVLNAAQLAATNSISTMVDDYSAIAWTLVLTMSGIMIGIKLFKKFTNKATS